MGAVRARSHRTRRSPHGTRMRGTCSYGACDVPAPLGASDAMRASPPLLGRIASGGCRRGDAGSHASPADDSGRPRRLARLGRAAKAAAARWMAARSGPRCSSLPALLTVRVIAIEMCPRLAPVLPPPRTRPPRCSGNRPQDTQNKPHRYSLLQRNSGVNHPTTRIRGRPTPCRRRPATALPDAHLARGSLPILRRIVSGGGWRCDQGRAMG